jgi:hypothetical protein
MMIPAIISPTTIGISTLCHRESKIGTKKEARRTSINDSKVVKWKVGMLTIISRPSLRPLEVVTSD